MLLYEFKAGLNAYLATLAPAVRHAHAGGPDRVQRANTGSRDALVRPGALHPREAKGPLTAPAYLEARRACVELSRTAGHRRGR